MDEAYLYKHINTADTYTLATKSEGILHSIVVGETDAGTITVSDARGVIATIKANAPEGTYLYNVAWSGFLEVVTAAESVITVSYK